LMRGDAGSYRASEGPSTGGRPAPASRHQANSVLVGISGIAGAGVGSGTRTAPRSTPSITSVGGPPSTFTSHNFKGPVHSPSAIRAVESSTQPRTEVGADAPGS